MRAYVRSGRPVWSASARCATMRRIGLAVMAAAMVACGKKGPPLAPIVRIPGAIQKVDARRVGNEVYLTFQVPIANIDDTTPAAIARVEVYGYTGLTPPPRGRFVEGASLVATVPVAPPLLAPGMGGIAPSTPPPPPAADAATRQPSGGAAQGALVTIRDPLSLQDLTPTEIPPVPLRGRRPATPAGPLVAPNAELRRFYMVVGFGNGNRPGPPSPIVELPLTLLPETPSAVRAAYSATTMSLEWEPSGGLVGFLLDKSLPAEAPPSDRFSETALRGAPLLPGNLPAGATGYNVYRRVSPDPLALPVKAPVPAAWAARAPVAAQTAPLSVPAFTEPVTFDGREVCYEVRAVRGTGVAAVEGPPTTPVCVLPFDTFAPQAPRGVSAVAAEGVIDLVWEPNTETDLSGYVVLRAEAGDATLTPLFERPIPETRFTDRTVMAGRRYVYAVVAADSRLPLANLSPESIRVEETAR